MRFHQVRELVRWAADYHAGLASACTARASDAAEDRVRMALRYVAEHERRMQAELERYLSEGSAHRAVLDTWYDDPADALHAPVLERLPERMVCDSVQTVLATALAAHRVLQDLYASRAEHAVSAAERDFFEALSGEHEGEVRRLSRDMQRLEDY